MMRLYFAFVVVFVMVQGLFAVREFMASEGWAHNTLDLFWGTAYESDSELIKDLQTEFKCQGFNDRTDRALELPLVSDENLPACSAALEASFGKKLQRLGSIILCIRLIQLGGVLLLSILFKFLASMERDEHDLEELEDLSFSEGKMGYCLTEKQLEEASARVPLLSVEDVDDDVLPHYYIRDAYVDNDGLRSEDSGDDSEGDDDHSDCRLQGYQSLSDDPHEQEFSVYVA
ncbi:hypothetical protein BGZ58_004762 [Dissophora ornata]|nr:hypothetical protein BGZ58_004762 [Dissophora ornata]